MGKKKKANKKKAKSKKKLAELLKKKDKKRKDKKKSVKLAKKKIKKKQEKKKSKGQRKKLKSITERTPKISTVKKTEKAPTRAPARRASISKIAKEKIDDLFTYRLIPWLLSHSSIPAQAGFLRKLKAVQTKIYLLDHYLETTWDLDDKKLTTCWEAIYRSLEVFGFSRAEAIEMTKQIRKYQTHEQSMRENKSPTRFSLRHFYYYKSCDVKLMRTIIYNADPSLEKVVRKTDWTDFDLITEVNDDISDLQEDIKIYNANRFLFQLIEEGKTKTGKAFRSFIAEIRTSNQARFEKTKSQDGQYIKQNTLAAIRHTLTLLRAQLSAADLVQIKLAKANEQ